MRSFYFEFFSLAVALAGQALALNIQLGGALGNVTAGELLDFGSDSTFVDQANCTTPCNVAKSSIQACDTASDDRCVCTNTTGTAILSCEQCLFTYVIAQNTVPPDPLLGSQPALTAFVAACLAPPTNTTIAPLKLALPASWMGPESKKLNVGTTVVAVMAGALIGGSSLYVLFNME